MKFNELTDMMQKPEPKPDTYEAGMALNQLLKIGTHAVKIHNMIDDHAEMESWVAKKIDLASNYVKSVHGYTAGSKAGTYDDDGMTEDDKQQASDKEVKMAKGVAFDKRYKDGNYSGAYKTINKIKPGLSDHPDVADALRRANEDAGLTQAYKQIAMLASDVDGNPEDADDQWDLASEVARPITKILKKIMDYDKGTEMPDGSDMSYVDVFKKVNMLANKGAQTNDPKIAPEIFKTMSNVYSMQQVAEESVSEDAGEGHMSKSQLYQTAKMAIELLDMIKKGDDLEGWVQTKLNLAADYLQAVYHYEDYQKLNPYREELDSALVQRHAGIIQKHLDEILERKCRTEDVDTKPGMMRILKKRVNEVEKEIAKENRKETNEGPFDGIGKAIGTAARGLGAKAADAVGMKKTAAGLQGRVDVDKKSAELDNRLAQYIGQQRADKNRIDPRILQGFLQKQGIDQKYMQYVKGPINQQQASKLMDKISADSFAGNVARKQPQDMSKSVAQRANQMKGVLGQQGGSAQQVAKGLGKAAQGQRMDPAQIKQLAPYAAQMQKIMADPRLAQVFKQLIMRANKKQTVTADVNEMDLDEGKIKDWAKSLAMAGIFVAGLAGVGSINDAINNSVPAIQAMNTALEMAKERGDDNLVAQIEKDLKGAKLRLDIGKDLNQVKYLQDKYEKFIQTESLTYESKLQINLNQRLK